RPRGNAPAPAHLRRRRGVRGPPRPRQRARPRPAGGRGTRRRNPAGQRTHAAAPRRRGDRPHPERDPPDRPRPPGRRPARRRGRAPGRDPPARLLRPAAPGPVAQTLHRPHRHTAAPYRPRPAPVASVQDPYLSPSITWRATRYGLHQPTETPPENPEDEDIMGRIVANFFIALDGVVESPDQWHFPYFNDEMGAVV